MLQTLVTALVFWLSLLEAIFALAGLRGVSWGLQRLRGATALALPWALRWLRQAGWGGGIALILVFLPALALQLGLSSLRRWQLNPLLQLRPGRYADRVITSVAVPGAGGPVPALHITPHGGARASVCVAHGSGCDKTFYVWRLVDALLAQGFATLLIDLDGHGDSPRPQAFPAILHNISSSVSWLRERYHRVGVIGISLGGCVAVRAVAEGTAVDALAVLEAPTQLRLTQADLNRIIRVEALRLLRPAVWHLLRDGSLYHVARAWKTSGIRAEIGTWDLFEALDLLGSLRRMQRGDVAHPPLLLIYGGNDAVVVRAEAERVRQAMPADAVYHLLPRASHISLPIEQHTIDMTTSWLTAQLVGTRPPVAVATGANGHAAAPDQALD